MNFSWTWFESNRGSYFDTLYVQNNILYHNGNSNSPTLDGKPAFYINSGNIIANPDLRTDLDFRPNPGSKAIKAGIHIPGVTYDIDSAAIGNPPNIGCYESIADNNHTNVNRLFFPGGIVAVVILMILTTLGISTIIIKRFIIRET
jgi:hypothetical protein